MFNFGTVFKSYVYLIILILSISISILPAENGKIKGKVTDSGTGETLPGATVIVKGTSIGNATDFEGKYLITQVPIGKQILVVSYVGYKSKEISVTIAANKTTDVNIQLVYTPVDQKEVVVTAQLEGQSAAINQQLSSNTIVNVVSKDKIQELPDQNAAESLGRLPGIALQRSNGEGQKVVIRGLDPRFSSITVNGVKLPSGDSDDRSVDLTMVSPDILEGIEVYKALRPDLDGDAIGGTVNFTTRKALEGAQASVRMFGGYNDLEKDYRNYRGSISYSNRFFKDSKDVSRLGVVVSANIQRANRASDEVSGAYQWVGEVNGFPNYQTSDVVLTKHTEIRKRYGMNLSLDYNLAENHELYFTSLWAGTNQDTREQAHNYDVAEGYNNRVYNESEVNQSTWSNSISGKHLFWNTEVTWTASYSLSKENTPWAASVEFDESSAYSKDMPITNLAPEQVSNYTLNNAQAAWMNRSFIWTQNVSDENIMGQLNIKQPYTISDDISGYFKFGGKIRKENRNKDIEEYGGLRWYTGQPILTASRGAFSSASKSSADLSLINFLSANKTMDFLSGYNYNELLNEDLLHSTLQKYQYIYKNTRYWQANVEDYSAGEDISAGYLMTELKWQQIVTFLPGFRYEKTSTNYNTKIINPNTNTLMMGKAIGDSLGSRNYDDFLPMAQIKIDPFTWMNIRMSATKSISRPSFINLIPYESLSYDDLTLNYGNPNLKETKSTNYDVYLSVYDNKWGLFTVGRFYKRLTDIDYVRVRRMIGGYYSPYLTNLKGYTVTAPENLSDLTKVDGWEFELQTNFTFLPSPFDGIILYTNFSLIHSATFYPYDYYSTVTINHIPYKTVVEMKRPARMVGQPDRIANVTIGYEKAGFSGRLSMIYQGNSLLSVGTSDVEDGLTDAFIRIDLVLQQRIWENLSAILQINNLTNREEKTYLIYKNFTTRLQDYGMTLDCGVQYKF
ncbi:MAG: TonB-dependent receptor [Ignavibacteriaceae bacterium]|nr:TonB-dependent receptor [Ignavibacteriaceae bacterium]